MTKEELKNEVCKTLAETKDAYTMALDDLAKGCRSFADSDERFELMMELDFWNRVASRAVDAYDRFDKLLDRTSDKCSELDPAYETLLLNALRRSFKGEQKFVLLFLELNTAI